MPVDISDLAFLRASTLVVSSFTIIFFDPSLTYTHESIEEFLKICLRIGKISLDVQNSPLIRSKEFRESTNKYLDNLYVMIKLHGQIFQIDSQFSSTLMCMCYSSSYSNHVMGLVNGLVCDESGRPSCP